MRQRDPARRPEEQGRERGTAAEAAQRHPVRDPLADQEEHQCPDGVAGGVVHEGAEGGLPGKQHLGRAFPGAGGERDGQARDGQADQRGEEHHPPLDIRPQEQAEPPDSHAERDRQQPDGQGPAELPEGRRADVRKARDGERERAQPRPGVQPDEHERADTGGQQARDQHHLHHRPAEAGGLHQEESSGQRRPEQCADGREAAGCGDGRLGPGRRVALDELDREDTEPAAEGDQGGLGAENHAQAQRRQRGQHDARKLPGGRWPRPGLEPVGGRVAALAGQVLDGQGHQHPGQQQRQNGPPQRFGVEAHALGQVGEDPPLQLADQGQKEVGRRRDGRADDRGDDQQNDIAPGPQQRERIGQRTHRASLLNPRVAVRGVADRTAT